MAKAELKPLPYSARPEGPSDGVGGRVWKWVIISGIVHVVVIAFLLIGPILFDRNKATPPQVYTVDLVGGEKLGGGAGTSVAPEPPKAKPKPQPEAPPEEKAAPPIKESKKEVKPPRDEAKEAREKAVKEAKAAEMVERQKAKKEAEEKRKAEAELKRAELEGKKKAEAEAKRKAEEEELAAKARLEELKNRRAQAALEDLRSRIAAKDKLEAEQKAEAARKAAADRAAADRAAAEQQARSTLPGPTPGAATLGVGGTGGGIQSSAEFIAYRNTISNQVRSSWTWVGRRNDLKIEVNLSIKENGEIASVRLIGTSGDRSFDESVLRAVKRASPLPPPPDAYRKEFSDVNVRFSSKELGG